MAYIPPQTTVTEITTTSVQPIIGSESNICLIGLAGSPGNSLAVLTTTDTVLLSGTTPVVLPTIAALNNDAQLVSVVSVTDILNPGYGSPLGAGYVSGTDFTVALGEGPPDGSAATITRVGAGNMPNGTLVAVTYTYVPSNYYNPIRLFDIGSVESRFGPSFAQGVNPQTGQTFYTGIASQLSFAARMAFANGAQSVICQPLFTRATPGNPNTPQQTPTAGAVANTSTWSDTLYVLRPISDIDIIVPVIGQDGVNVSSNSMLSVFGTLQTHLAYMNSQQVYIEAILGEDGTSSQSMFQSLLGGAGATVTGNASGSVQAHVAALQANFANQLSAQCVLINNTVFQVATPGGYTNTLNVGGQYAAAAVAGALSSRPVSSSLTHSPILGFQSITDPRATSDKNSDAAAGLFVIENYQGIIRCRHSITIDIVDGAVRQELSVVLAKFLLEESIRQTLDNQIIGQVIADSNSPMVVGSAITGVLSVLQQQGAIVGYTTPVTALSSINPTIITATFSYRPAFPIDYVNVSFNLDLTTGSVTSTLTGASAL
jgi:hypothetical protein